MLIKFAWRAFKRHAHNYLFYFFSMVFAVMVYYSFTAMTYEQPLIRSAGQNTQIVSTLAAGSITVVLILLFFMTSMSRFFLESRKQDITIFRLNGLKQHQIVTLFLFELFVLGLASFVLGIFLGILGSKLFSMILVKAMGIEIGVHFFISFASIATTAFVMLFILCVVSFQIIWGIAGFKLSRSQEKERIVNIRSSHLVLWQKVLGVIGILLLASGWGLAFYYLAFVKQLTAQLGLLQANFSAMLIILVLCVLGTYLFYAQSLRWYAEHKSHRLYRNLRLLSRSDFRLRLFSEWNFFGTVTIFLGVALMILGGVAAFVSIQMNGVNEAAPVSLLIDQKAYQRLAPELKHLTVTKRTLNFKTVPAKQKMSVTGEGSNDEPGKIDTISLTDYQRFQQINPYLETIQLKRPADAVMLLQLQTVLKNYLHYAKTVHLQEKTLHLTGVESNFLGDQTLRYGENLLVVSNQTFEQTKGYTYQVVALSVPDSQEEQLNNLLHQRVASDWIDPVYAKLSWKNQQLAGKVQAGESTDKNTETIYRTNYISHLDTYRVVRHRAGLLLFIVTFVAMTFIITTASTVCMRQISEMDRKKDQYRLLSRLGIAEKNIDQLIYRENRSVFFPPAILGLLHSIFAIRVFTQIVQSANYGFVYLFCGIMVLVYSIFYLATCWYQKKLLHTN